MFAGSKFAIWGSIFLFVLGCSSIDNEELDERANNKIELLKPKIVSNAGLPMISPLVQDSIIVKPAQGQRSNLFNKLSKRELDEPSRILPPTRISVPALSKIKLKGAESRKSNAFKGISTRVKFPNLKAAKSSRRKDNASVNIQCIESDAGLVSPNIISIIQDSRGHLWFGATGGGVSRYDGTNFLHLTPATGLAYDVVFSIHEDRKGALWFGLSDYHGVVRYDGQSYTHFGKSDGFNGQTVYEITGDEQGGIWFALRDQGAVYYDGSQFISYGPEDGIGTMMSIVFLRIAREEFGLAWELEGRLILMAKILLGTPRWIGLVSSW